MCCYFAVKWRIIIILWILEKLDGLPYVIPNLSCITLFFLLKTHNRSHLSFKLFGYQKYI